MRHSELLWDCWLLLVVIYTCFQSGNANNVSVSTQSISTLVPTPSATVTISSQVASTSHMSSSSTNTPAPTPFPIENFISFSEPKKGLYMKIQNISISFNSHFKSLTAEIIERMGFLNDTFDVSTLNIKFQRYYGVPKNPRFFVAFYFVKDASEDNPSWFLQNFQHADIRDNRVESLFNYKGIQSSIWAPSKLQYQCTNLVFHGTGMDNQSTIVSTVNFTGISIQPFINDEPSSEIFNCARNSINNNTIGLVVGLSLSLAVVVAAVVIIISIVAKRYSHREYDILKD